MAERVAISSIVATIAFWAYTQTLLPGVDLGDTGGFQAAVLWPEVSARQAYPLYYGLARPFVALVERRAIPRAHSTSSRRCGRRSAVGLLTFVCASVTRSLGGGIVAGIFLAFSYTFWTQAIIAEVYSLHLALIGLCLVALHAYALVPGTTRLFVFLALYAVAFGNHLAMILFLLPFGIFVCAVHPRPVELFRPRLVAATVAIVAAAAMQYAPNFMAVWGSFDGSAAWTDRAAAFWFDVTKQDWRETMVLGIGTNQASDRLAMWWFDARQQFGVVGLVLAAAGAVAAVADVSSLGSPDSHGFWDHNGVRADLQRRRLACVLLPSHYLTAFCIGSTAAFVSRWVNAPDGVTPRAHSIPWLPLRWRSARASVASVAVLLVLAYGGWRAWSTWPAVDRHEDRRGEELIAQLALGLEDTDALLVAHMNWQLENVLLYMGASHRRDLAWIRLGDVLAALAICGGGQPAGSDVIVVMNAVAAAEVIAAYGPAFPLVEDGPCTDAAAQSGGADSRAACRTC